MPWDPASNPRPVTFDDRLRMDHLRQRQDLAATEAAAAARARRDALLPDEQHGTTTSVQCACGMFAVGGCAECSVALCSGHGVHVGGRFLCREHARAVNQRQAAAREQREREQQEARLVRERTRAQLCEAATPGFPAGAAAATELAAALERLVPDRKRDFVVGFKFGRVSMRVRGWGLPLWYAGWPKGSTSATWEGLIITTDGDCYAVAGEYGPPRRWAPTDAARRGLPQPRQRWGPPARVPAADVAYMRDVVMTWRGVKLPPDLAEDEDAGQPQFSTIAVRRRPPLTVL